MFNYMERLSDVELRQRLAENGFPNLPVTETTRKILMRKLKYHIKNELYRKTHLKTSNHNLHRRSERKPSIALNECDSEVTYQEESTNLSHSLRFEKISDFSKVMPKTICTDINDLYGYSNTQNLQHNFIQTGSGNTSLDSRNQINKSHLKTVNRLLSFRDLAIQKQPQHCQIIHTPGEPEINHQKINECIERKNHLAIFSFLSKLKTYLAVKTVFNHNYIPCVLICSFVIYFILLTFMYLFISLDISKIDLENNMKFSICPEQNQVFLSSQSLQSHTDCVEENMLPTTILIIKELFSFLQERTKKHFCTNHNEPIAVSALEFIKFLHKKNNTLNMGKLFRSIKSTNHLIQNNPHLKLSIVHTISSLTPVIFTNKQIRSEDIFFRLSNPELPLTCTLNNKINQFFVVICKIFLFSVPLLIFYSGFRYSRMRKNYRMATVEHFTTDIVNELLYQASLSDDSDEREIIINQLRDKIIPLKKRGSQLKAWNDALKLLKANDNRIQFGTSICNSEEIHTIKWVGNTALDYNTKQWQSPAFGNTNKIYNPPTPCLKIRHMFVTSENNHPNLKEIILEAIIYKVGAVCNIHDIQIDKQSCCVYVRCASEEDAGIIHNAINGWWFDKRLLSIKFLRLQRYLSRFPKSSDINSLYRYNPQRLCLSL